MEAEEKISLQPQLSSKEDGLLPTEINGFWNRDSITIVIMQQCMSKLNHKIKVFTKIVNLKRLSNRGFVLLECNSKISLTCYFY